MTDFAVSSAITETIEKWGARALIVWFFASTRLLMMGNHASNVGSNTATPRFFALIPCGKWGSYRKVTVTVFGASVPLLGEISIGTPNALTPFMVELSWSIACGSFLNTTVVLADVAPLGI